MREDDRAIRAELAARQEEIATLRGVVAALRGALAGQEASAALERKKTPDYTSILVAVVVGVLCGASFVLLALRLIG
jgi:hypothetical protein